MAKIDELMDLVDGFAGSLDFQKRAVIQTALEAALKPGEPVAWIRGSGLEMLKLENGGAATVFASEGMSKYSTPLYTAAPPAQPDALKPTEVAASIEQIAADRYKVVPSHESMFHRFAVVAGDGTQQLYLGREVECENMARKFAGAFLDGAFVQAGMASPPAQTPDALKPGDESLADRFAAMHENGNVWITTIAAAKLAMNNAPPAQPDVKPGEPYGWYVPGSTLMFRGECAQLAAQDSAKRIREPGTELPLYTAPQAQLDVKPVEPEHRTEQQIVDQTEELARWLMLWSFNREPVSGAAMRDSENPFAQRCWAAACHIQEMLTATDVLNAVAEIEAESCVALPPAQTPEEETKSTNGTPNISTQQQTADAEARTKMPGAGFHGQEAPDWCTPVEGSRRSRPTGFVTPKNHYSAPVLFDPYTGEPRDVRDVQSDPQGILIVPPGKVDVLAAPTAQTPPPRLTESGVKALLDQSDLLDMFLHVGWYSAPASGFKKHGTTLIRAIEAAVRKQAGWE